MNEKKVNELILDYKLILDRSVVLYGSSDTGKTTITQDIMHCLLDYIDQIIVCNKNEDTNDAYAGKVPKALIHKNLTSDLLKEIWDRQEILVAVYNKANDINILRKLFSRLNLPDVKATLDEAMKKESGAILEIQKSISDDIIKTKKIDDIKKKYLELYIKIYKKFINDKREHLLSHPLTDEEKYSMKYMNMNPRLLLVIDDCVEDIKRLKKDPYFCQLFTAGRHRKITCIIIIQDDVPLSTESRKNAFVNVFTTQQSAISMFTRPANSYPKDVKERALEACKSTFSQEYSNQKLIYHRKLDQFFKFTATKRDNFRFGSEALWKYSDRASIEDSVMNKNNAYFDLFKD